MSSARTPPRRRGRNVQVTPPRDDQESDDSDGNTITEHSPLRRSQRQSTSPSAQQQDDPPVEQGSPAEDSPITTRAQQRAARRRAANSQPAGASAQDDGNGSGPEDDTGQNNQEQNVVERGRVGGFVRGLGRRIPRLGRRNDSNSQPDTAAGTDADRDGDADNEGTAALAPGNSDENANLTLGLTERAPPIYKPSSASTEASLYRRPRSSRGGFGLFQTPATSTVQPIAELADGLHVASMPQITSRAQRRHASRLGTDFMPPSKAPRLAPGVVLRQPDPVRHVRVRPSHPGMATSVDLTRPKPSTHLVDAASRTSGTPHTLQVSIGLMQLHDHPLFREEHMLQRRLRSLAEQLGELHSRETLLVGRQRVAELRRRLDPYLTATKTTQAEEVELARSLCIDLLQARRERDEVECAERLLGRRMLDLWHQLKAARRRQGFASTRAKLQVQMLAEDDELEAELEEELEERRLLHLLAPSATLPFDEVKERTEIEERQRSLRRGAGEQTLVPVYTEDTPPTDLSMVPRAERRRQIDAGRVLLYAVLLVDGRVVGQAETRLLHPFDFCARFNASLQLHLLHAPHTLSLQLWQRKFSGLADVMMSEVFLAVPDVASPAAPRWQHYTFASNRTFGGEHARGTSTTQAVRDGEISIHPVRCLCGQVNVSVAWATPPASRGTGLSAASYSALTSRGDANLDSGSLDPTRVRHHIRTEDLDPNAPQDVPLLALLARSSRESRRGFRAFRFGRELQMIKDWMFSDRQQLLQLRRDRPHDWHLLPPEARAVPHRDAEIPAQMRELLQGGAIAFDADDDVEDSRHKSKIRSWAKSVKAKQQRAHATKEYVLTTEDVVREPLLEVEVEPFDLNAILENAFTPRRKLLPRARARKPEAGSDVPRKVEIVVVDGSDMPIRVGGNSRARLFVEVSFQGKTKSTELKTGASPIWNQRIDFDLSVPNNDWTQQALMNMSADVCFNLFDRVERSERDERETNGVFSRSAPHYSAHQSPPLNCLSTLESCS